jgi:hypothetical protein
MALAALLVRVAVKYLDLKSVRLLMFLPLMLAFGLGDTQMYSTMPRCSHLRSPYNVISSLLYQCYGRTIVYAQFYNSATPALQ